MSDTQLRNIVEAALLAADRPLSLADLASLFDEAERPANVELRRALEMIEVDYEARTCTRSSPRRSRACGRSDRRSIRARCSRRSR